MPADDIASALDELRDACDAYEVAESYYEGTVPEVFFNPTIRRMLHGSSTHFRVNLACKVVNAVRERLEIIALVAETDQLTAVLNDQVWHANRLELEAPDIHRYALTLGDAYAFCWDGRGWEPTEADGAPSATIMYNSPKQVRAFYDEDNPREIAMAVKSWEEERGAHRGLRVNLYYPDGIERYVQRDDGQARKGRFELIDEIENPYGRVPFFHFRTRRPYGTPEHANAYGPQDALTKLIINQMTASDFAAFPQRYGLVETGQATDDADLFEDDDDPNEALYHQSHLVASPGTIQALRYFKSVGQFASADIQNFLAPMDKYVHLMAATTATPMSFLDPTGNLPSGEAQRQAEAPLIAKVHTYEREFGATWRDLLGFAMTKVLGVPALPTVHWAPAQVLNDLAGWQTVKAKVDAGVPVRVALMEAGYTDADVSAWGFTAEAPNGRAAETTQPALPPRDPENVTPAA